MKSPIKLPTDNLVLFGSDSTSCITAVEVNGEDTAFVYRRDVDGTRVAQNEFRPYMWVREQVYFQEFDRKVDFVPLKGNGAFRCLAQFQSWQDFRKACSFLSVSNFFAISDPTQQYLMQTGKSLFKNMQLEQLHRMQIGLIVDAQGLIESMQLTDSTGWEQDLAGAESDVLEGFVEAISSRDPDAIEGHDIFRVTLPKLIVRAKANRVPLPLGRDGSIPRTRSSRVQVAEKTFQYPKCHIWGRHVVDTFILSQFYDISARSLEGFQLDEVAEHFGFHGEGPELVEQLSTMLSPSYVVQAQIFPYSYQDIIVRGNATKIDALFLREYLQQQYSIPELTQTRPFAGGYTDMFREGIVHNVWHCDAQSLYPSLLIANKLKPSSDDLNLFLPLLSDLRHFRLVAKSSARQSNDPTEQNHCEALQQTFKILINSFYGYLGFSGAHFGDIEVAERVTSLGRELLRTIVEWLKNQGCEVIEADTDGLYFVPPQDVEVTEFEKHLKESLPKGVDVEIDGQFPAMFSYKRKNYVLLDTEGNVHITGSALRSRGLEKFQRNFLKEMFSLALTGKPKEIPQLYEKYCGEIEQQKLPIALLTKTDTLQEKMDVYQRKIETSARNRSAAYELALQSTLSYQPGDQITYYVTGVGKRVTIFENCKLANDWDPSKRDENVDYYLDKLRVLYKKFAPLLECREII